MCVQMHIAKKKIGFEVRPNFKVFKEDLYKFSKRPRNKEKSLNVAFLEV